MNVVSEFYGISKAHLYLFKRGYFNEPRNVAVYLARRLRCDTLTQVCEDFSINKYSSVISIMGRVEQRMSRDKKLKENKSDQGNYLKGSKADLNPFSTIFAEGELNSLKKKFLNLEKKMKVERTNDEILVRFSPGIKTSKIQNILDYLRYEELTSKSEATEKDVENLTNNAKSGRLKRTKNELGINE